jgi:hypothetical protein
MRASSFAMLAALLLPTLVSCERFLLGPDASEDATSIFEHLWQDVLERYTYFELKGIDWHEVGDLHRARVQDGMPEEELFEILADMLNELRDGHVNLTSPFNRSRNWSYFQDFPHNYNQVVIDRHYLERDFWITGPLRNQIIDSVLYVNYRSFMEPITQAHLDALMNRAQGTRGVILDVRSNLGGNSLFAERLASCFTEETYTYARMRIKTGPCETCYSSWNDLMVNPRTGLRFTGRVVVLTDRMSYSTTTWFAQMMRQNENAVLVGDITGGGAGTPAYGELANGWIYRFSSTQTVSPEGEHLEPGVPVDYEVRLLPEDEAAGVDTIIEFAMGLFE